MGIRAARFIALLFIALFARAASAEDRPQLSLPIVCQPHSTCFIQNYVDIDPGPGVSDYRCGKATYDQHSGVDFRVLSAAATKAGISVVASADGTVKAVRDGVEDVFFTRQKDVEGRECGNGVILDHGGGWETQYCHMKKGSLRVSQGQAVKRGDRLGDVGFSGMADFAQVHLTVRHNGKIIDPFLPDSPNGPCQPDARGPGLWEPAAAAAFPYRNGEMIAAAFAGGPPDVKALERDHRDVPALTPETTVLVLYGRFINLLKGDRVHFVASGPHGQLLDETSAALEHNKAAYVAFAGRRRDDQPWAAGHYDGRVELIREQGVIAARVVTFDLK
jgi:hypothetical protein